MCENLLKRVLQNEIPITSVLEYLAHPFSEVHPISKECLQIDFASYFLNYIHELQVVGNVAPEKEAPLDLRSPPTGNPLTPKNRSLLNSVTPKGFIKTNDDYCSPVSPLYNPSKRTSTPCLGDFIVNTPKSSNQKKAARRINPTSLNLKSSSEFTNNNSFSFNGIQDNSVGHRSVLAEECLKLGKLNISPAIDLPLKSIKINSISEIVPCLDMVTSRDQLDKLITIYNHLLKNNYILNFISELHFLITVLLTKEHILKDDNLSLFKSLHNRIYFVSNVLLSFDNILGLLDKPTLRLIIDNKRLQHFVVLNVQEFKCEAEVSDSFSSNENVRFNSDTDNRTNFPSEVSFHCFRKQRDLFFEILRIWENNHLLEEWNFGIALSGKIKALLNMHSDAVNFMHLARLFKAQLLLNAFGTNNDDLSFISSISNVNTEKLQRLKNRILSKNESHGIHAKPTFSGYQEFYRDFILTGSHHMFNKHLSDTLISNIEELNDTKFDCVDLDDSQTVVNEPTRKLYISCLKSLQILAKFLGFLDALPYTNQLQAQITATCIQTRRTTQPVINLLSIINHMNTHGNLILTIPWLTIYLSMLDYTSLRLPYFEAVLHKLFHIYCANIHIPIQNLLFIKVNLGWLFELPQLPEALYYDWLKNNTHQDSIIPHSELDSLNIIDHTVIYMCCPYLYEIKQLLSNDAININNTVKHITPLSSIQPTYKRLQLQLEEAFFYGQPVSVRKTVEFVSERIASACVKYICNEIVPNYRQKALEEFRNIKDVVPPLDKTAADHLKTLQNLIDDEIKNMMGNRIGKAIDVMFAPDILSQTKTVCNSIATQSCLERVRQWTNSHVNTSLFIKDFEGDLKSRQKVESKKPSASVRQIVSNAGHNDNTLSGNQCVENIRSLSWKLLQEWKTVTSSNVKELLCSIRLSIDGRHDLNDQIIVLMSNMLVDLVLLLATYRPDLLEDKIIQEVFIISGTTEEDLFKTIICPKNVMILMQSPNVYYTLNAFSSLMNRLIKECFLTQDDFEVQINVLYGLRLHKDVMAFLYCFLWFMGNDAPDSTDRMREICNFLLNVDG